MCLGAIGTQTGGSLVRPASYCGVSACKPTWARTLTEGVVPVSFHLDHTGPIARTARDLECMLRCLICVEDRRPVDRLGPPRLGFVEPFFMDQADEAIREATETAVRTLADCGAKITPVGLPEGFADVHRMHRTIMAVEAAAVHRQRFQAHREAYGPAICRMLDEGLAVPAVDYAEALAHQRGFRRRVREMLNGLDALIMPATDTTAPASLATTGDSKFQAPWSYAGLPVVSIPCGLASDSMPAAVQLVGRVVYGFPLLGTAQWCEAQLGFDELPPLLA
jgi:aspartyl-tRNA(Asn)/glutamyl-tRNA(Gln) amidotransferase subunit A